jgi:hypothetical protein
VSAPSHEAASPGSCQELELAAETLFDRPGVDHEDRWKLEVIV